jgi:hypothetical protein
MTKRLLVAWLLGLALASPASSTEPEWTVVETGRAGLYWSFSLKVNPDRVPPGGVIANESRWSEPPASGTAIWYYAGTDGRTAHFFVIFQEYSKPAARILEIERRPILVTFDQEDAASITLFPVHAKSVALKLKRNPDQTISVSVPPK